MSTQIEQAFNNIDKGEKQYQFDYSRELKGETQWYAAVISKIENGDESKYLKGIPDPVYAPKMADYRNSGRESIENLARAYLDINCGHCHNPGGPANTSGLFLHVDEDNPNALGVMKSPVAAGRGSGGKSYSIVPGVQTEW